MITAIIDYGAGNLFSIANACRKLGKEVVVTSDSKIIRSASKVIFPGVGNASIALAGLQKTGLLGLVPGLKQPLLGICLGMQMMHNHSEEGDTKGLGIFDGVVRRFNGSSGNPGIPLKVPHVGWNRITRLSGPLFYGVDEDTYLYFVHSYYAETGPATSAVAEYGISFSAALERNNFFGCQFHPEKSGEIGLQILNNFLNI